MTSNEFLKLKKKTRRHYDVGDYEPRSITRGATRHSTYADCILLFQPLVDPRSVKPEFSPIENPSKFVTDTVRWIRLWLTFAPWIEAGLLRFVPDPGRLDPALNWKSLKSSQQRFDTHPELKELLKKQVEEGATRRRSGTCSSTCS